MTFTKGQNIDGVEDGVPSLEEIHPDFFEQILKDDETTIEIHHGENVVYRGKALISHPTIENAGRYRKVTFGANITTSRYSKEKWRNTETGD